MVCCSCVWKPQGFHFSGRAFKTFLRYEPAAGRIEAEVVLRLIVAAILMPARMLQVSYRYGRHVLDDGDGQ